MTGSVPFARQCVGDAVHEWFVGTGQSSWTSTIVYPMLRSCSDRLESPHEDHVDERGLVPTALSPVGVEAEQPVVCVVVAPELRGEPKPELFYFVIEAVDCCLRFLHNRYDSCDPGGCL